MDFPIFISLADQAGTFEGGSGLVATKNSAGVHLFWSWDHWKVRAGWRFAFSEVTPFSSTQSYVANPTMYMINTSSGLSWAELAFDREFPLEINRIITLVPSLGLVWEPQMSGSVPTYASGADFSPLFAEAKLAFHLTLQNDFYLSPEFSYATDILILASRPFSFAELLGAQQVLFGVELGYKYGGP